MKNFLAVLAVLLLGVSTADAGVKVVQNVRYGDHSLQNLDIYMPDKSGTFPIVVFAHGGRWCSSDKSNYRDLGLFLAERDIVAFVCNYRLSPAVKHPAHTQDFAKAVAWVLRNADDYHGEREALTLMGYSAGAHLACLVALDRTYLDAEGVDFRVVKNVATISGVYEITTAVKWAAGGAFDDFEDEERRNASPIHHINRNSPRFLLLVGSKDIGTIEKQTKRFHNKLLENGCNSRMFICRRRDHNSIIDELSDDVHSQDILKFLREVPVIDRPENK